MNIFSPQEVFKIAIVIEENGRDFYLNSAKNVKDNEIKRTLGFLGNEEETHRKTFQNFLETIGEEPIVESYPGEYQAYLKALSDEVIFNQKILKEKTKKGFKSQKDLLEFALKIEKDSIIFYQEIKNYVLNKKEEIDKILEEERKHFIKIWELLNN